MTDNIKYRHKTLSEINNVNIDKIRTESLNMCDEVINNKFNFFEDQLTVKYNYLFQKVPSIFNKILRDINDEINKIPRPCKDGIKRPFYFDKIEFEINLKIVLQQLCDIQNNHTKNDNPDTHKMVSDKFNEKYIPNKFLEK